MVLLVNAQQVLLLGELPGHPQGRGHAGSAGEPFWGRAVFRPWGHASAGSPAHSGHNCQPMTPAEAPG